MNKKKLKEAKTIHTFAVSCLREVFVERIKEQIVDESIPTIAAVLDKEVEDHPLQLMREYSVKRNKIMREFKTITPSDVMKIMEHLAEEFDLGQLDDLVADINSIIPASMLQDTEIDRGIRTFKLITLGKS